MTETICQIGYITVTGTTINPEGISLKVFSHTCYELKFVYSGTPLLRTPLGEPEVSLLKEVSSFQGSFCTYLYVGGTKHSVLFKVDVLISGVSL